MPETETTTPKAWPDNAAPHRVRNAASPLLALVDLFILRLRKYRGELSALLTPTEAELLARATRFDAGPMPIVDGKILHRDHDGGPRAEVERRPSSGTWVIRIAGDDRRLDRDRLWSTDRHAGQYFPTAADALRFFDEWRERSVAQAIERGVPPRPEVAGG